MKKTILLFAALAFFVTKSNSQTVTDYDGNIYNTLTIGTQVWMKENLKVTHYRNGDNIPNVISYTQWKNINNGAYCDYNNSSDTSNTYGKLYNWYAINDSRNIAPKGWHVPNNNDLSLLRLYLGGPSIAGGRMKETDTIHWFSPNIGATNESGFTALPAGGRFEIHGLMGDILLGSSFIMWSSTVAKDSVGFAFRWWLDNYSTNVNWDYTIDNDGFSVRCIKDSTTGINDKNNLENINIYPNPAFKKLYINCVIRQNFKMQVYNTVGQCILQRELNNMTNEIDISSLTKGIYILKLTSPNGTIEKKIIKE